jgi:ABC-2 type transport system permease protein
VNLKRALAIAVREGLIVARDKRTLAMAFLIPVVLLILFGAAISFDVEHVPTVVVDLDNTTASREVASRLVAAEVFAITRSTDIDAARRGVARGEETLAVIVPLGFARDRTRGRRTRLWVILDGADAMVASIALSYLDLLAQRWNETAPAVDARLRLLYNPEQESSVAIIPGLTAVIIMLLGGLLTSLVIAREDERGTLEWLLASPLRSSELVFGKAVPYFVIGLLDVILALSIGVFVFGVPLLGSFWVYIAAAVLFLVCALGLGLALSTGFRTQQLAFTAALVATFLPSYLLSGFAFPIENMPTAIKAITYLVPARYFVHIARAVQLKGSGFAEIWREIALLAGFSLVLFSLAIRSARRRLD